MGVPRAWDSQCSICNRHPDLSRASLLLDISCRPGPTQGSCEGNTVNIQVLLRRRVTHKTPRLHVSRTASARWHSWALLPFKWIVLDGRRAQNYEAENEVLSARVVFNSAGLFHDWMTTVRVRIHIGPANNIHLTQWITDAKGGPISNLNLAGSISRPEKSG
jgi:hypothetical protein